MTATYDPRLDWRREDEERAAEAARPVLETAAELPHEVWGYWDAHTHASVTELHDCEAAGQAFLDQQQADEVAAERAYERYLDDRGYWDAREQEDREAAYCF